MRFVVFLSLVLLVAAHNTREDIGFGTKWAYNDFGDSIKGPANWNNYYTACGTGASTEKQSPVNIPTASVVQDNTLSQTLSFNYGTSSYTLSNEGYSVRVALANPENYVFTNPRNSSQFYKLSSLHFHWDDQSAFGSEHLINGSKYALELHLVHFRSDFASLTDAIGSGQSNAVSVVAVMFNVDTSNDQMQVIANAMPSVLYKDQSVALSSFSVSGLLPSSTSSYYSYSGSLTTPGCYEVVQWVILGTPATLSQTQLNALRSMYHVTAPVAVSSSSFATTVSSSVVAAASSSVVAAASSVVAAASSSSSSAPPVIAGRQTFDVTCNARPVQPLNGRTIYVPAVPVVISSSVISVSSYYPNVTNITSSSGQFAGIDKPTAASAVATLTLSMLLLAALIAVTAVMVVYQIRIAKR